MTAPLTAGRTLQVLTVPAWDVRPGDLMWNGSRHFSEYVPVKAVHAGDGMGRLTIVTEKWTVTRQPADPVHLLRPKPISYHCWHCGGEFEATEADVAAAIARAAEAEGSRGAALSDVEAFRDYGRDACPAVGPMAGSANRP